MTAEETLAHKKKKNLSTVLMGIGVGLLLYISGSIGWYQYQQALQSAPATDWVEVTSLVIPNFQPGVDPTIDYVRDIKQNVSSQWSAELRHYDDENNYTLACTRNGFSELEPGRGNPPDGWKLGSFAGKDCVTGLQPGRYRLYLLWDLRPRGFNRSIPYQITSNTFFIGEASGNPK